MGFPQGTWHCPGKPNLPLGLRGKAGGCARVTAGPKRPHLGVCPGLETRPDSPGEPGMQPRDPCLPWRGKFRPPAGPDPPLQDALLGLWIDTIAEAQGVNDVPWSMARKDWGTIRNSSLGKGLPKGAQVKWNKEREGLLRCHKVTKGTRGIMDPVGLLRGHT